MKTATREMRLRLLTTRSSNHNWWRFPVTLVLGGPIGSVVARMPVEAEGEVVEAKAQQTAQNSEHMAMRCNHKSL